MTQILQNQLPDGVTQIFPRKKDFLENIAKSKQLHQSFFLIKLQPEIFI